MIRSTFKDRALTLAEARQRHASVELAAKNYFTASAKRHPVAEDTERVLVEAWEALVGTAPIDRDGFITDAIRWTIPANVIPLMRRSDSVPAAFAFSYLMEELARADRHDDLQVRAAVRVAWDRFERRRLEANHVEEGFGCDESASWHTLRDIVDGAGGEMLKRKMLAIAELAGRMFDALGYTPKRVESDDPQEVRSTKVGGDIARLLPAELAKLTNGRTRDLTAMKVLKKQAQQYRMRGERTKTRGPLVLALDESASMHDSVVGVRGRNCWAKAAAVALIRVAWAENRPVRVVHFGYSTVVQEVPKGDHDALFEMARSFLSGGTSFTSALITARREVGDLEKDGYKGADILLITDGQEHDHARHNQQIDKMDEAGVRLWTVAIGMTIQERAPVRARAERYVEAHDQDLGSSGKAAELVKGLKGAALARPDRSLN